MRNYFQKHQASLVLKQHSATSKGFRNCQLGAIWAAKAHFSVSNDRALINLPTGAGKTAVMMALAFELGARRIFILTPSMFSREQTATEFRSQRQLSDHIGALKRNLEYGPRVKENESDITSDDDWRKFLSFDVVVSTANAILSPPPPEFFGVNASAKPEFDLVFVDEGHHSPADTWTAFLDQVHASRVLLFTATPFRRDRKRIRAKPIYVYPISKAINDGIYRPVQLVDVKSDADRRDAALAEKCRECFFEERKKAPEIAVIIKAKDMNHAEDLKKIYEEANFPKLGVIYSRNSYADNRDVLEKVKNNQGDDADPDQLHGFICVDIANEGIDVPNLRIAVFHDPPQTLPYTIQVIGRVTRISPDDKTNALLIVDGDAAKGSPEIRALYASDEGWSKLLPELFEKEVRETRFLPTPGTILAGHASLPADDLYPYQTVRVYQRSRPPERDPKTKKIKPIFSSTFDTTELNREISLEVFEGTDDRVVAITRTLELPRWTKHRAFEADRFDLHVYCYVEAKDVASKRPGWTSSYVFEFTTSEKIAGQIRGGFWNKEGFERAGYHVIRSGLADAPDGHYLMVGMIKQSGDKATPQYKTLMGESVQNAVKYSDGRSFSTGHAMIATDGYTRGIATHSSRIWSNTRKPLAKFEEWCQEVAEALAKRQAIPKLEQKLIRPVTIDRYPPDVEILSIVLDDKLWRAQEVNVILDGELIENAICFYEGWVMNRTDNTITARLVITDQKNTSRTEIPVEHKLIRPCWSVGGSSEVRIQIDRENAPSLYDETLEQYLEDYPPLIVLMSGQSIRDEVLFNPKIQTQRLDEGAVAEKDWSDTDITKEAKPPEAPYLYNVQQRTELLIAAEYMLGPWDFLICDDRANEAADYVLIQGDLRKKITFFHCKYKVSGHKPKGETRPRTPGLNRADLTELVDQAVRTAYWIRASNLIDRLLDRMSGRSSLSRMVHGKQEGLKNFAKTFAPDDWLYAVVLVQPALSRSQLISASKPSQAEQLLIAVSDRIETDYAADFKIWANA
jgi:superfamily II DNA or RNA helicase